MKILLDTHFILWLATEPHLVRPSELAIIREHQETVVASVISFWEIRVKAEALDRRGNRKGRYDLVEAMSFIEKAGFAVEVLTRDVVVERLVTDIDHSDPFDRMLLVHAQQLGARLLTRDEKIIDHPLSLPL